MNESDNEPMLVAYAKWHYSQGLHEFVNISKNFFWFIGHFFSLTLLSKTLFLPWKRLGERYGGGLDLEKYASTLIVNLIMRLVGFVTRMLVILVGLASFVLVAAISLLAAIIWLAAPAVLIGSVVLSITFFAI